ncbi:hypothetical protein [Rubinisphaera margarita]|uniref:hypothetical protein n=1 Tax=Rubinisphaera margarita TaxID=2909586 RepID=UPI001EE8048C|nr:hypothetical protein [Rubinisphaera margarita]MCG6154509.1 hypothetical protein [Rubinisphaera margarita]
MIRILGAVIGIFSTATLLTVALVFVYSWGQGHMSREAVLEIAAIVKGEPRPSDLQKEEEVEMEMTSYDEIVRKRTEKILSIAARESELAVLKKAIDDQTNLVMTERQKLEQIKKTFKDELEKERTALADEAVAQARAILLKMDPESGVEKLLALNTDDAVLLLKGMPEKDAARILDQFRERIAGKDPMERVQKAEEIYKAIYRGEPLIDPADRAQQALMDQPGGEIESR